MILADDPHRVVKFKLLEENYELLYSAAAFNGENLQTALNRATALYEAMHRGRPGQIMSWTDGLGEQRSCLILPAKVPMPWYLSFLKLEIT